MIRIKKLICKYFGHNFGVYPSDRDRFEMAGYCKRCGYDTHDKEKMKWVFVKTESQKILQSLKRRF